MTAGKRDELDTTRTEIVHRHGTECPVNGKTVEAPSLRGSMRALCGPGAFRAIDLAPETGQELFTCGSHRVLGDIYHSKGEEEKVRDRPRNPVVFQLALRPISHPPLPGRAVSRRTRGRGCKPPHRTSKVVHYRWSTQDGSRGIAVGFCLASIRRVRRCEIRALKRVRYLGAAMDVHGAQQKFSRLLNRQWGVVVPPI